MTTLDPTVLVVDDDKEIRQSVMDILRRVGCRVVEAADGPAAIAAAVAVQPDLVFLDMTMPGGMDGAQVAEELRRRFARREIPVVALSAGREPADRERALEAGCNLYLTKPCAPDRIREVAKDMLRKRPGNPDLAS
ncbi:MAG: response regulator [Candidatus Binatia bacterium]|nr:response regulator [Candidatus Binatia bacterium]